MSKTVGYALGVPLNTVPSSIRDLLNSMTKSAREDVYNDFRGLLRTNRPAAQNLLSRYPELGQVLACIASEYGCTQ